MTDTPHELWCRALIRHIKKLHDREPDSRINEPREKVAERHVYCLGILDRLLREVTKDRGGND